MKHPYNIYTFHPFKCRVVVLIALMLDPRLSVKEIRKDGVLMEGPSVDVGGGSPWIARLLLFSLGNILIVPPYSQSSSDE